MARIDGKYAICGHLCCGMIGQHQLRLNDQQQGLLRRSLQWLQCSQRGFPIAATQRFAGLLLELGRLND